MTRISPDDFPRLDDLLQSLDDPDGTVVVTVRHVTVRHESDGLEYLPAEIDQQTREQLTREYEAGEYGEPTPDNRSEPGTPERTDASTVFETHSGWWFRRTNTVTGEVRPHGPFDTRRQAEADEALTEHVATLPADPWTPGVPDDRERIQGLVDAGLAAAWRSGWLAGFGNGIHLDGPAANPYADPAESGGRQEQLDRLSREFR